MKRILNYGYKGWLGHHRLTRARDTGRFNIVAAHKAGMKEFCLGMTAARVVRHANCSVLVIRNEQ